MVARVPNTPTLPTSVGAPTTNNFLHFCGALIRALFQILGEHANRLNASMQLDGTETPTAPIPLVESTVAGLSAYPAADWESAVLYVSDGTGNKRLAISDGTNWRFPDGNVVS